MGFNAPTIHPGISPETWDARQRSAATRPGADPALTAQIQQLPSYPAFVQAIQQRGSPAVQEQMWKSVLNEAKQYGLQIPDDKSLDFQTANIRDRTWTEKHPVLSAVLITAGFAGGGAALGAMAGAGAAGAASGGVGFGETGATVGLASGASLPGATVAGGGAVAGGAGGLTGAMSSPWFAPATSAASNLVSAKLQSNAADRASRTQAEAADKALAFQKEQYQQSRADFNPYLQAGADALGRMGTAATAPVTSFRPGQPQQLGMAQGIPPQPMARGPVSAGAAAFQGQPPQLGMAPQGPQPQGAQGGALWTIQSPDGETKQLPQAIAQQFIARGARRVA
jgi:hypothetical protein